MKLTYWVATQEQDRQCYNVRGKTRKEVVELLKNYYQPEVYSRPKKVVIEYRDGFDLMMQCLEEGGCCIES